MLPLVPALFRGAGAANTKSFALLFVSSVESSVVADPPMSSRRWIA